MANLTNVQNLENDAIKISNTPGLKPILILECIFGIFAIFPNLITMTLLFHIKVFHVNLRLLLGHLSLVLIVSSIGIIQKSFRRLLIEPKFWPVLLANCVFEDWPVMTPLHNIMFSLLILIIERVYATVKYRKYDNSKPRPYLAILLLISSWMAAIGIQLSNYTSIPNEEIWVSLCETNLYMNRSQLLPIFSTFVVSEAFATSMMILIFIYNRSILMGMTVNRARFNLSCRFQVDQNVKMNIALLPSAILHALCYLPNNAFLLFTFVDTYHRTSVESQLLLLHSTFLWRVVYACLHPIMLIVLNPNLKKGLLKCWLGRVIIFLINPCCCSKMGTIEPISTSNIGPAGVPNVHHNVHFYYLNQMWNGNYEKRQKGNMNGRNKRNDGTIVSRHQ